MNQIFMSGNRMVAQFSLAIHSRLCHDNERLLVLLFCLNSFTFHQKY